MDSITQLTLGAAIGEAVLGKKVGYKAAMWGAICGTLPDLDVFISFGDPIRDFTYHRGVSHSFFFLTLLTPLVAWIIIKVHSSTRNYAKQWLILVWLALCTHPILDSFTIYGTQILLPFTNYPVAWSTIFIVDPFYTVPLLIGVLLTLFFRSSLGKYSNHIGLTLSCIYLIWSLFVKMHVDSVVKTSLESQQIQYTHYITGAAPLNTLLWRVVVMKTDGYYEGYYSIFDERDHIDFTLYESDPHLLTDIADSWEVQRLQWFTKGFYHVREMYDGQIILSDLRMGSEPFYVFQFILGEMQNSTVILVPPQRFSGIENPTRGLEKIFQRIMDQNVRIP